MKTTTLKAAAAVGLSALLVGSAAAQESKSKPVGYETIGVPTGFSYAGLRLHEAPVASGEVVSVPGGATVTVADGVADALADGTAYIFEVTSGDAIGAVVTVDSFDAAADTVTLSEAAISDDFADGDTFTIRPAATLASVFGAANSAGLDSGFGGTGGADQVWVINESGGFDKYYYDDFSPGGFSEEWVNADTNASITDPAGVSIIYTDGIILFGAGEENSFVVSGSVKLTPSSIVHDKGFNYFSSVSPAGATLASMFGTDAPGLGQGFGGTGDADQIWVPNATGFDKFYFDQFSPEGFAPEWVNADTNASVDPATVSLDDSSGFVINNDGGQAQTILGVPDFYSTL